MTTYIDPAAKLFQHLDRLSALQQGVSAPPVNVEIDLSNRCSLGCEWCHFAYTHTRGPLKGKMAKPVGATIGGDLMDTELAYRIVSDLREAGVKSITWTGGGEPTLHPDFDAIIEYTHFSEMEQGIYTHGGHVNPERAALMKQALTFVYVSLDAATAESYKQHKGVDRFEKACQGIRNLVAAEGSATIGIGYLLTEETWRDWPRMIALSRSLGADYCQFRPTIHYDEADPSSKTDSTAWMSLAIAELDSIHEPDVIVDTDRLRRYQDWSGHGYETCYWSQLQSVITPNGKMWTCVNKREYPDAEIGDLSVQSFAEVWADHKPCKVGPSCRVMCRGHMPNLTLNAMLKPVAHKDFI